MQIMQRAALWKVLAGAMLALLTACQSGSNADLPPSPPAEPSAGCGTEGGAYGTGTTAGRIRYGDRERTFLVHVPPAHDGTRPIPVVFVFHGGAGSGANIARTTAFDAVADREGFIAVYPDGTGIPKTWNGGFCCGSAARETVDDVGFVRALLDHLEESLCADRRRIFATGMSNGAILTHRLGCEAYDRIAAIAPVAGTEGSPTCSPTRAVPVMQVHGTQDTHVPWEGGAGCGLAGVDFPSVPSTMEGWRLRNGCRATTHRLFEEGDGICDGYDDCADGGETVLCTIVGGGHGWPGGDPPPLEERNRCPDDGEHSTTFHASEQIWRFFARQARP